MQQKSKRVLVTVGGLLTAILLLSVPVLAASTIATWGQGSDEQTAIEASDDAVSNGLHVVKTDAAPTVGNSRAAFADRASEKVLSDWRFTHDKSGSPGI